MKPVGGVEGNTIFYQIWVNEFLNVFYYFFLSIFSLRRSRIVHNTDRHVYYFTVHLFAIHVNFIRGKKNLHNDIVADVYTYTPIYLMATVKM